MRISKSGIESIINRLYTMEQNGEKVIRPDRLDELTGIISGRYDNSGCTIEKIVGGEKLVVFSVSKNGIKKIFERKIGVDENSNFSGKIKGVPYVDIEWYTKDIIKQLNSIRNEFGAEIFQDRKRIVAVVSDTLCKYPEESKIIRMVFNEGVYSVFENMQKETEEKFVKVRLQKFLDNLGLETGVKNKIADILIPVFVSRKQVVAEKYDVSRERKIGLVHFIAVENSVKKEQGLFRITSVIKNGEGLFDKKGIEGYINALNETSDAYRYLVDTLEITNLKTELRKKNFCLTYANCRNDNQTANVCLATLIALCSGALDKPLLEGVILLGNMNTAGEILSDVDIVEALKICDECKGSKILLPINMALELSKVPAELLGKFSLYFYNTPEDAVIKALNIV